MLKSVFNKVYEKETSTQVFSSEICKIFKNTYFEELLGATASTLSVQFSSSFSQPSLLLPS